MNEEEANIRTIGKDIIQIPERAMSGEEETPLPQGLQGAQDQASFINVKICAIVVSLS